jgi:glycylpeptide N-tetradecanoyltransferase
MCEVNFLAVHRSLRSKRMAQIVIQEVMRRKRVLGFPQAYYTSGHSMPTPFCTSHYANRFINSKKLVEIKYTNKPANMTMKQFEKKYQLPDRSGIDITGNIRKMEKKDISIVLKLFNLQ